MLGDVDLDSIDFQLHWLQRPNPDQVFWNSTSWKSRNHCIILTTLISREKLLIFLAEKLRENAVPILLLLFKKIHENAMSIYNFHFTRKIAKIFWSKKIRENATVLYCLAVDNFNLTRKIAKFLVEKNSWKRNVFFIAMMKALLWIWMSPRITPRRPRKAP